MNKNMILYFYQNKNDIVMKIAKSKWQNILKIFFHPRIFSGWFAIILLAPGDFWHFDDPLAGRLVPTWRLLGKQR
jgi:hypothetical protein